MKAVALKIDFKIDEQGIVRVVDVGPGLSADNTGFRKGLTAELLRDLHAFSGAPIMPIFGEFIAHTLRPELLDVPVVLRKQVPQKSHFEIGGEFEEGTSLIPLSFLSHMETCLGYAWKQLNSSLSDASPQISFSCLAGYKILWSLLLERYMHQSKKPASLFWCNDDNPDVTDEVLGSLNSKHGYFIKIVNSSGGCGENVFYVACADKVRQKLSVLHQAFQADTDANVPEYRSKKIFSIEPAYVTSRKKGNRQYNATGRAFLTLGFDEATHKLQVNVAEANWFLPHESLGSGLSEESMMSNSNQKSHIMMCSPEELEHLTQGLLSDYRDVFNTCFMHDDLLELFESEDIMQRWFQWFPRTGSLQAVCLDEFKDTGLKRMYVLDTQKHIFSKKKENIWNSLENLLAPPRIPRSNLIAMFANKDEEGLLYYIEAYSCLGQLYFEREGSQVEEINGMIRDLTAIYLHRINPKYDADDFNRALRQAVTFGHVAVAKLLIYTRQVDVNTPAPKGKKQTPLQIAEAATHEHQARLVQLLKYAAGTSTPSSRESLALFQPNDESVSQSTAYVKSCR